MHNKEGKKKGNAQGFALVMCERNQINLQAQQVVLIFLTCIYFVVDYIQTLSYFSSDIPYLFFIYVLLF